MAITFETEKEIEIILQKLVRDGLFPDINPVALSRAIFRQKKKIGTIRQAIDSASHADLKFIREWQAAQIKKPARGKKKMGKKKRQVQIRFFGEIDKLRNDGYSFAEISDFLGKYHKAKISQVSIWRYYTEQKKLILEAQKND